MTYLNTLRDYMHASGYTLRDRNINILKRSILSLAPDNPAYKPVIVNNNTQYVVVNSKDDYLVKELVCLPDERIPFGSLVMFSNMTWLNVKTDVDDEIYSKCEIHLCNCKLRWKDKYGTLFEYDGVAEDATKYSEGVESNQYMRIAEFQIKVKVRLDEISANLKRDMRFIIDADKYISTILSANNRPFVFRVTRRNIITGTFADEGYVEITLVQDQWIEGKDDPVNMIAYQVFEDGNLLEDISNSSIGNETGWL